MAQKEQLEHWSSEKYQSAASFVPKLATKVLGWLDVQKDDVILDVGCGDGVLNLQIAEILSQGTGKIHGVDSSAAMITAAQKAASANPSISNICTFEIIDATTISQKPEHQNQSYDKVFSNAAMHWILRPESTREMFFKGVHAALKPNGTFVFEMGGMGNVAEMRTALLLTVSRRVGLPAALKADPWFFPDEIWMTRMLEETVRGFRVERIEREYRPTKADEGGIEGWVRLMGKQFFDVVSEKEREDCIKECLGVLESVCNSPGGGDWFGYVRLRAVVRKV